MRIDKIPVSGDDEVTILARVLSNAQEPLSAEWARHLLTLRFSDRDEIRMNELAKGNRQGALSETEKEELLGYAKAGCLLGILHSKARRALNEKPKPTRPKNTVS